MDLGFAVGSELNFDAILDEMTVSPKRQDTYFVLNYTVSESVSDKRLFLRY